MPFDRSRYPANWEEISRAIKERAGWCCERCGLAHNAWVVRGEGAEILKVYTNGELDKGDGSCWYAWNEDERGHICSDMDSYPVDGKERPVRIILTTAHLGTPHPDGRPGDKHDKMDCRPENLQALCQRCHLLEDLEDHIANARATRARKRQETARAAGQIGLFDTGATTP